MKLHILMSWCVFTPFPTLYDHTQEKESNEVEEEEIEDDDDREWWQKVFTRVENSMQMHDWSKCFYDTSLV